MWLFKPKLAGSTQSAADTASISQCFMTKHCKKNRRKRYSFIYNFVGQKGQTLQAFLDVS